MKRTSITTFNNLIASLLLLCCLSLCIIGCDNQAKKQTNPDYDNTYTICWKNYDGSILETDFNVPYGSIPSYDGITPAKGGYADSNFEFNGWSPSITAVTCDKTYIAQFTDLHKTYTVTWLNYDGTVLETDLDVPYGSTPIYNGATPIKEKTADTNYTFSGWSPKISSVVGNTTYTAQYTSSKEKTYKITWKNYDGSVLETDENVPYGSTPSYDGKTPSIPSDAIRNYSFSGWSPNISPVTGNATYVAQFTAAVNTYTITWKNYDGTVLEVDKNVQWGSWPTYNGKTPTKKDTEDEYYTFKGWSPYEALVTENATYTATFYTREYTHYHSISFRDSDDGTYLSSNVNMGIGDTYEFEIYAYPSDAKGKITLSVSDSSVLQIVEDGMKPVIKAVGLGTASVIAVTDNGLRCEEVFNCYSFKIEGLEVPAKYDQWEPPATSLGRSRVFQTVEITSASFSVEAQDLAVSRIDFNISMTMTKISCAYKIDEDFQLRYKVLDSNGNIIVNSYHWTVEFNTGETIQSKWHILIDDPTDYSYTIVFSEVKY